MHPILAGSARALTEHTVRGRLLGVFLTLQRDGWFAAGDWQCCEGHGFEAALQEKPDADAFVFFDRKKGRAFRPDGSLRTPLALNFGAGTTARYRNDTEAGAHLQAQLRLGGLAVSWNGDPNRAVTITGTQEVM